MPTVAVNLDVTQYVQVNTAFSPLVLQALNDTVRITISELKPAVSNTVFHTLGGKDAPLHFNSIDTNVWALAITEKSSLIVSENAVNITSTLNSRAAATLAAGAVFQGVSEKVAGFGRAGVSITSDNATDGVLTMEVSHDNVTWGGPTRTWSDTRFSQPHMWNIVEKYFRIKYTNGTTEATNLSIQVQYSNNADVLLGHQLDETLLNETEAIVTRSILVGQDEAGNYNNANIEDGALLVSDFFHDVGEGKVAGHSFVHKFGKSISLTTNYTPLAHGKVYPTPQIAGATTLRIKAGGNIQDAQNGTGARSIFVEGLGTDGAELSETLLPHATDGTLAGVSGSSVFLRVFRAYVLTSGSHANPTVGSHAAKIVVEDTGGTEDWAHIDGALAAGDFPRGQSQIGVYTVPFGFTAYVYSYVLTTDGNKPVDFIFYQRGGILETAAPYSGTMRAIVEPVGVTGEHSGEFKGGQRFPELTDIGWMAKGASTPTAGVDFEIVLVAN